MLSPVLTLLGDSPQLTSIMQEMWRIWRQGGELTRLREGSTAAQRLPGVKQLGYSSVICGTLFYLLFDCDQAVDTVVIGLRIGKGQAGHLLCSRTAAFPAWHCCFAISLQS